MSVSAYPFKIFVKTDNGKLVEIYMQGDEHRKFALTKDNYTILNDVDGWWYASQGENGQVGKSAYKLVVEEDETKELKDFKASCPKKLIPSANIANSFKRTLGRNSSIQSSPIIGERHALVILMQYKDTPFKHSYEDFDKLFNHLGYKEDGMTGSIRDFYRFASQGQLDYVSDIYGPFTSKYPMRFYGENDANGNDTNPMELCREALCNLPNDLDLSLYDNNGDGIIDNVHIIYAGYGEEAGAASDAIWAHEYPHQITVNNREISVAGYSCSPELRGNTNSNITYIGVICHELGHALGAMDYYDTNYGTGGEYIGTGQWDVMASGSWNNDGKTPPNFNPYVRNCVFGWNKQEVLNSNMQICMPRMELNTANQSVIYRMETEDDADYFLLENRQRCSFDESLPGEGLLIYHVHPDIERYRLSNMINATHPQCLYPVCASGSYPNARRYGNINTAGCPFPGENRNTVFSAESSPVAVGWNGGSTKVCISNIKINHTDGSISFSTWPNNPDVPDADDKNVIYKESFEQGISAFVINSITGKETWKTYKKGNFVLNPSSIPEPSDGDYILMLYTPKGGSVNESELISPYLDVTSSSISSMKLDICCDALTSSKNISFTVCIDNDDVDCITTFEIDAITNQWTTVEIPLNIVGDKIRYRIRSAIGIGGVFVDNIQLLGMNCTDTRVAQIKNKKDRNQLYTIDGKLIGNDKYTKLNNGLYLFHGNGKTEKIIVSQ